jgi:molybdate transport system substrate-binding protein
MIRVFNTRRVLAAFLCSALLGWQGGARADMLVAAAASLTNVFTELVMQFQQANPGTKVLLSFAGSDTLAHQVSHGAPIDVFAPADHRAMQRALDAKAIEQGSLADFAGNSLVLIVPKSNPGGVRELGDLKSAAVSRVAIANPALAPAGRYAQAGLQMAGLADAVKQREVLAQNVRQVLDYVARGEVDAGVVFATDAAIKADQVTVVAPIDLPEPVRYPIALVNREGRHPLAPAFLKFVLSPQGRQVLERHGFQQVTGTQVKG